MFPDQSLSPSLADRLMHPPIANEPNTLGISLGANLPSSVGTPIATLLSVRPKLEEVICEWLSTELDEKPIIERTSKDLRWRWSPLFETDPVGGPSNQDAFINAVLVVDGQKLSTLKPSEKAANNLLERFLKIERNFGRNRQTSNIRWGPRSLDLDLLAWGGLQVKNEFLSLPHPRLIERSFVVVPLGEALNKGINKPRRIPPQESWQE